MAADDSGYSRLVQEGWSDEDDNSTAHGDKQLSELTKTTTSRDPSAPNYHQTVELLGDEQFCSNSIFGFEVNIHASQKSSLPALSTGSSKVKITTITNQSWDLTNRYGYLVASSNDYLAYVLEGRTGYVIRIIDQLRTNRGLLKGFTGAITDVTFAHAGSDYLAAIDQGGNLYIWKLEEKEMEVKAQLILHVARSNNIDASTEYRLVWCPYVTSGSDEVEYLFAVALGTSVEVWNLDTVLSSKPVLPLARSDCKDGVISLDNIHNDLILDLAISPDANVLATAGRDGHVKFWSISSSNSDQHVCLHDWTPHGGDPVSRLMFCDNLLTSDPNAPFWRFLVTGATDNTEVKLWCAQTWKCLQTIRFLPAVDIGVDDLPSIKMCLDLSASYLLAADSKRTVLYVLQLYQDPELGQASFTSITDHLLTQSILSFVITGPVQPQLDDDPSNSDLSDEDDINALVKFDSRKNIAIIRLHCIQTKSVQELMVRFEPQDRLNMPPQQLLHIPELAELYGLSKSLPEGSQSLTLKSPSALISELDKSPHSLPPAVAHIDTNLTTPPDTVPYQRSSSQPLVTSASGGASGELISKGFSLESSVDPPSLTTYMSSPLSSLTTTSTMTLTGPIGNFSFNSQKLLSPAEFVSSPPHSLSSFSKVTPSDFSSALPSVASSTAVAEPATPTSVAVQTSIAPPPITSAEDSSPEISLVSSSSDDSDDDKVTPQDIVRSSFQDINETLELPKPEVTLAKISTDVPSSSDSVIQSEAVVDESNKLLIPEHDQTSEATGGLSPQQNSELLQIEGRVSQTSSEFASANDLESESEEESAINVANNVVDTGPYSKPQSVVDSSQLFPSVLPDVTDQPTTADSDGRSTNNNVQFIQCNKCSTFNSCDVLECSHCGCAKNDQWTPQSFLKAVTSQNSTDLMIAQCPSTVDVVAAKESTSGVESSAVDSDVSRISYTSLLTATALDHDGASVHDVMSESPIVTLHGTSSLQPATATTTNATGVTGAVDDKVTSHSIDSHLTSSTSVGSISYSMKHQELTSSVVAKEQPSVTQHSVGEQSLNELHQLVVEQQQNMNVLRQQMDRQGEEMMERLQQLMVKSFEQQENVLVKKAEKQQQVMERMLREKQESDQLRHEQLISALSQSVSQTVSGKLDKVMKTEMKQSVVPAVNRSLTSLQENFSTVLQQKLTATDSALKEGVTKILKSKSFADSLGGAAAVALQGPLKTVYEQMFQSTILPQFDRSCQAMCQQINNCFQQGTRQYLEELQRHLDSHRQQSDTSHGQLLQQLSQQLENTARIMEANNKMSADTLATTLSTSLQNTVQQQINHSLDQLQSTLKDIIVSSIHSHPVLVSLSDQLKLQAKDSNRKVKEEELLMMIQNKELNKAFEVALTATDLHLVLFVCNKVDPDELFDIDPPCLSQPVLLSLIQHLSCNMNTDLDIKMRYLEHSILALNTSNEVTRSHMPGVLSGLCQQLQQAEELLNLTSPSTAKKLRRLRMVAERLAQPS